MEGNAAKYIKNLFHQNKPFKVCILDNGSIEFLTWIKEKITSDKIFNGYDIIFIPGWVGTEVNDSDIRREYIMDLRDKYKKKSFLLMKQIILN